MQPNDSTSSLSLLDALPSAHSDKSMASRTIFYAGTGSTPNTTHDTQQYDDEGHSASKQSFIGRSPSAQRSSTRSSSAARRKGASASAHRFHENKPLGASTIGVVEYGSLNADEGETFLASPSRKDGAAHSLLSIPCLESARRLRWAIIALLLCAIVGGVGVLLVSEDWGNATVGRYFIAAAIYGAVCGASNFLVLRVLMNRMFLLRNERQFKRSIRELIMTVLFEEDFVDAEIVEHVRHIASTVSVQRTLQQVVTSPEFDSLLDAKLLEFGRSPDAMVLNMMGIPTASLKALALPLVLSVAAEMVPVLEARLDPGQFVSAESIQPLIHQVVARRVNSLSLSEVRKVVAYLLFPHLSFMVVGGVLLGAIIGVLTEVAQLSRFMSNRLDA